MTPTQLTKTNFQSTLARPGLIFVDCWAPWCGGCKQFGPVFDRVASRHPSHAFLKLDTSVEQELAKELGITHIPALMVFSETILVFHQPGNFEEDDLEEIVSKAENLDMDRVRAEIEGSSSVEAAPGHETR